MIDQNGISLYRLTFSGFLRQVDLDILETNSLYRLTFSGFLRRKNNDNITIVKSIPPDIFRLSQTIGGTAGRHSCLYRLTFSGFLRLSITSLSIIAGLYRLTFSGFLRLIRLDGKSFRSIPPDIFRLSQTSYPYVLEI